MKSEILMKKDFWRDSLLITNFRILHTLNLLLDFNILLFFMHVFIRIEKSIQFESSPTYRLSLDNRTRPISRVFKVFIFTV